MTKRILFTFAHPDDETFTVGGTLAEYAKHPDIETIVYSATLGDAGKCGNPPVCSKEELALVRKEELKTAAAILGVDHLLFDTYRDGHLSMLSKDQLKEAVLKVIEKYQPEIVVTFPPHGLSGHKDHHAIQQATLEAVKDERNKAVKTLFYATFPESMKEKMGQPAFADPDETIAVTKSIKEENIEKVRKALLAHKTQHLSVERVFPTIKNSKQPFLKFDNCEYFVHAWGASPVSNNELFS
ncbi:PIG-L deacetylase family protein [Bacillus taeanensis]|uniref:N-acetylglucosaminylphosphatidylinositol deacetylase n=1 Tax=Bacillus taeanensis TaxID=273032 RepID=A0A366Y1M8_9BACI|nr:PIG-L family deacetylase [Bacillus taeanensis]RBW70313.1 N-acetylglucosaminylphosphatidylinositol deacetylase [Bacillus taeanensis]